jgi:hypothetical protein
MTDTTKITVTYTSIDRCRTVRTFKTLAGARKFAAEYVGHHPEIGCGYAISSDGIGKVTVKGCTLANLFRTADLDEDDRLVAYHLGCEAAELAAAKAEAEELDRLCRPYRTIGCTCSDQQLSLVGCECVAENPIEPAPAPQAPLQNVLPVRDVQIAYRFEMIQSRDFEGYPIVSTFDVVTVETSDGRSFYLPNGRSFVDSENESAGTVARYVAVDMVQRVEDRGCIDPAYWVEVDTKFDLEASFADEAWREMEERAGHR